MWFLFGGTSTSFLFVEMAALFYCGTSWTSHIIFKVDVIAVAVSTTEFSVQKRRRAKECCLREVYQYIYSVHKETQYNISNLKDVHFKLAGYIDLHVCH